VLELSARQRRLARAEVARIAGMATAGHQHADARARAEPVGNGVPFDADCIRYVGQP
jgi:Ni,Fe-hydrogenase I large subunit